MEKRVEKMGVAHAPDKFLGITILALIISGIFIFSSASFGLLGREGGSFVRVAITQLGLGLGVGTLACYFFYRLPYIYLKRFAFYIFLFSIAVSLLLFTSLGLELNGA